jgi:hypothetical protein
LEGSNRQDGFSGGKGKDDTAQTLRIYHPPPPPLTLTHILASPTLKSKVDFLKTYQLNMKYNLSCKYICY